MCLTVCYMRNEALCTQLETHKLQQVCSYRPGCESHATRAVARALIGGCIFIYSGRARLVSFGNKVDFKRSQSGRT